MRRPENGCPHTNERAISSTSGYPSDTSIEIHHCPDCKGTWTEEYTMAELRAMQEAEQRERERADESRLLGRVA